MNKLNFCYLFLISLFLACGNSTTSPDQKKSQNTNDKSCLEQYKDSPCAILTTDKILELAGFEKSKIELKEPITMRSECVYMWTSGRTELVETSVTSVNTELNDKIDIGYFKIYNKNKRGRSPEEWFKSSYPITTKEELAAREARYKENGKEDATERMLIRVLKNLDRQRIDDLGDRALVDITKNMTSVTVVVMDKNIAFQVSADVGKDKQINLEVAKKIAQSVLDACN